MEQMEHADRGDCGLNDFSGYNESVVAFKRLPVDSVFLVFRYCASASLPQS
jgi:hypothetical protein